jgi:ribose 1,5-bisphosphate isomerase
MSFDKVLKRLKNLEIQGAENVAVESVNALYHIIHSSKSHSAYELIRELKHAEKQLIEARPTEPCMRNCLKYALHGAEQGGSDIIDVIRKLDENIRYVQQHFADVHQKIVEYGAKKITSGQVIFTHCHSSSVVAILLEAKRQGKSFEVHNTETRPKFQGRITAAELAKAGIKVTHYVDSAARQALKKADLCLFGADAIQADGVIINKIGTELFAEIANGYDCPIFFCTDSWKYDPESAYGIEEIIEKRNKLEVWPGSPKGVNVINPAFEKVHPSLATGIISELGVFRPSAFVEEVRQTYPWLKR